MKYRLSGDQTKRFHDPEAIRMNALRKAVPSAFWLEDWKQESGRAYYDIVSMTTVVETED